MGIYMEQLRKAADLNAKKKWKDLNGHSFNIICNALIKLIDKAKDYYYNNQFEEAYVEYLCVVNIYYDYLDKKENLTLNKSSNHNELKKKLKDSIDTIEQINKILKEKDISTNNNISRSNSNLQISSPSIISKKTITSEKIFSYIERIISGNESKPPQILLIDIRERKDYDKGHINWSNNTNLTYNGVINIPINNFYGVSMDIHQLIETAVQCEVNDYKKNLIRNMCKSDLIVYYDKNSVAVNDQVYQRISDILYHSINGMKIQKPPVMLENGYDGWLKFIQENVGNISKWTESSEINNHIDYTARQFGNMNIGVGNQNINEVNKSKVSNYSNEIYPNNYYAQFQQYSGNFDTMPTPQQQVNSYSQPIYSQSTQISNTMNINNIMPSNDYYSNINITPSAPPSTFSKPNYPALNESTISMPQVKPDIPAKPYTLKYHLPSSNNTQPIQPTQLELPNYTQYSNGQPSSSYNSSNSSIDIIAPKVPPKIPERHKTLEKIPPPSSSSSYESINSNISKPAGNNPPAIPNKPKKEYSLNEIHNTTNGSVGLRNLGNTCYMNSILQCLNAIKPLTSFFLSGRFRENINKENDLGTYGKLAEEYYRFLYTVWNEHQPTVSPTNIKSEISKFNEEFMGSDQHDSQEFLSCILDGLHEDLNVARKGKTKRDIEIKKKEHRIQEDEEEKIEFKIEDLKDRAWKRYIDFNYSIIVTTFQGQYVSLLKCTECKKVSPTFNSLMYLSVPIPKNANTLYDCLEKYSEIEYLNGNDGWNCPRCKKKVNAIKRLKLSKLPDIMLIHLKRFYYEGPFRDKITKKIDFPLENLDLEPYTFKAQEKNYKYNLFAISNHYGTLSGGHYTAFVKNKYKDSWIEYDDSRYSDIDKSKIKTEAAYILFYVKTDKQEYMKFH